MVISSSQQSAVVGQGIEMMTYRTVAWVSNLVVVVHADGAPIVAAMLPCSTPASLMYQALYDELDPTAAQVLDLFFDFVGPAGLSNFAAQDADPSGTCVCCTDRSENFTGGAHWFTTIGSNPYYPANETGGVYDATVGKTALGSAKGTLNNSAKRATVMIDLGKNCALDKQVFSYLMSPFQGRFKNAVLVHPGNRRAATISPEVVAYDFYRVAVACWRSIGVVFAAVPHGNFHRVECRRRKTKRFGDVEVIVNYLVNA